MQHAMWIGREDHQQLGGVAGHLYVEFDGGPIDPERLRAAATALARRHPMLRVRFLPDGTQRIGRRPADFAGVASQDLRDLDTEVVDQRLAAIRDAKSHQQLDGEVFELAVTLLPGERSRLHVDLDMQAADAMSYRTLMADLAALYARRRTARAGLHLPASTARRSRRPRRSRSRPAMPTGTGGRSASRSCRTRRRCRRSGGRRSRTRAPGAGTGWTRRPATRCSRRARARGITPAMALAAAFSNAVARWSADPRFLLNVPLFGRQALHPDVDLLVGDFTSSLLLDIDLERRRHRDCAGTGGAGRHADRRRAFRLPRAVGVARSEPASRHPGAGAGGVHQRAGARRTVQRRRHRPIRHARSGSSRRARRCCWTRRSPSSTAGSW